jgi:uncharacterized protein
MILPDVNVLIYAFRADVTQHVTCRPWLAEVVASDARFGVSPLALSAVVRIATNPRSPASGIGTSSSGSASRPMCEDRASPMPGSRLSQSKRAASGSRLIAILRGFPD